LFSLFGQGEEERKLAQSRGGKNFILGGCEHEANKNNHFPDF